MVSAYKTDEGVHNAQDLDDLFLPLVIGTTPAAATFIKNAGQDLNQRYHPIVSGAVVADVGYKQGGVDIAARFQNKLVPVEVISLTGGTIDHFNIDGTTCGIRIDTDGYLYAIRGANSNLLNSLTDWITPHAAATSEYYFMVDTISAPLSFSGSGASGNWQKLDFDLSWYKTVGANQAMSQVTFTLHVKKGAGGATIASAVYVLRPDANNA